MVKKKKESATKRYTLKHGSRKRLQKYLFKKACSNQLMYCSGRRFVPGAKVALLFSGKVVANVTQQLRQDHVTFPGQVVIFGK